MKSGELTAGQFANLSGLTKADLAQFDRIDLFSPAKRAKNGATTYTIEQLPVLTLIKRLLAAGVTESEIKTLRTTDSEHFLQDQLKQVLDQIVSLTETASHLIGVTTQPEEIVSVTRREVRYFKDLDLTQTDAQLEEIDRLIEEGEAPKLIESTLTPRDPSLTLPTGEYLILTQQANLEEGLTNLTNELTKRELTAHGPILSRLMPINPGDDAAKQVKVQLEVMVKYLGDPL